MEKFYSVSDFEWMQRTHNIMEAYYKYYEQNINERDEEKGDKIKIEFLDENNYMPFYEMVKISGETGGRLSKKVRNCYENNTMLLDYFCRLMIYSYAVNSDEMSVSNLHKGEMNTFKGKEKFNKLISSGNYTSWKNIFMESGLAEELGIKRKVYQVKDFDELLSYPALCVLMIYECLENDIEIDDIGIDEWAVIKKAMALYENGVKYTEWNEHEKNKICMLIFRKPLYDEKGPEYLYGRHRTNVDIEEREIKKLYENILDKGNRLSVQYNESEMLPLSKEIQNDNVKNCDERQVWFSKYLAPVIAAICDFFCDDPFGMEISIWKKEKEVKGLVSDWLQADDIQKKEKYAELSLNYNKIINYIKYNRRLFEIFSQEEFLQKYYYFYYLMIYKIRIAGIEYIDGEYKFIQYYIVEQLLRWKLIKKETGILYENAKKGGIRDVREFLEKNRILKKVIEILASFEGVITRIDLAEQILNEYFDLFENMANEQKSVQWLNHTRKKIQCNQLFYNIQQRIFLEKELNSEEVKRGDLKNREIPFNDEAVSSYADKIKDFFRDDMSLADKLKNSGHITKKDLLTHAKDQIDGMDDLQKEIEIWVISHNCFKQSSADVNVEI